MARKNEWDGQPDWAREDQEPWDPTEDPSLWEEWTEEPADETAEEWEELRSRADRSAGRDRSARGGVNGLLIGLIVLLVLGMLFAAWQLGRIFLNYHRDRTAFSSLAAAAVTTPRPEEGRPVVTETEEELPQAYAVTRVPIAVDWEYLRAQNSDIVGWLYCPGTIINYPVVQTTDNDYYLKRGFDQQQNTAGTLFADTASAAGVTQSNYIIYGHNMKDESMFGTFKEYVNEEYLLQNPSLYYLTPDGAYRVDLFALHIVEGTVDNFPVYFSTAAEYQGYIDRISSEFTWFKPEIQSTEYQMMTLSTCTSAQGIADARLVLHGVMIPIE